MSDKLKSRILELERHQALLKAENDAIFAKLKKLEEGIGKPQYLQELEKKYEKLLSEKE